MHDPYERLATQVRRGARLNRYWPLTGGVSAITEAMEIELEDGDTEVLVVRQLGAPAWKGHGPEAMATEHGLLHDLHRHGLPVPEPVYLDTSGGLIPLPFLVMTFVEGTTTIAPDSVPNALGHMADALVTIHMLSISTIDLSLPSRVDPLHDLLPSLTDTPTHQRIRATIQQHPPAAAANQPVLLHGDFWPGNLLWRDGRIVAIIDWEDAAIGDPCADLASSRLELLWKYGQGAMETFTRLYLDRHPIDRSTLPYWELMCATGSMTHMGDWALDPEQERTMRERGHWLIDDALRRLETS